MAIDINKFSIAQMTSNNNGKTSGSGTMGIYIIVFSVIMLLFGGWVFYKKSQADVMMYASANILVGAGLLGYRKSKEGTGMDPIAPPAEQPVDQPPA
jgi:hypothetical protein